VGLNKKDIATATLDDLQSGKLSTAVEMRDKLFWINLRIARAELSYDFRGILKKISS